MRNPELWQSLQSTPITLSDGSYLAAELVSQYQISPEQVAELMTEYRRFLYSVAVAGEVLAPSTTVDQLWHLHLADREAWTRYCDRFFGRELRHLPGRPAPEKDPAYQRTLALIRQEFGITPSWVFWPDHKSQKQRGTGSLNLAFIGMAISLGIGLFFGIGWGLIAMVITLILAIERHHNLSKSPRLRRRNTDSNSGAGSTDVAYDPTARIGLFSWFGDGGEGD
ncbi:MAG: glycine-rich domain-containing protein [Paracoccus sp. (in: a-proteobacteria)]